MWIIFLNTETTNKIYDKITVKYFFCELKLKLILDSFSFISQLEKFVISTNAHRAISFQIALSFAFSSPFRQRGVFAKRRSDRTKGLGVKGVETLVWFFAVGTRWGCCFSGGRAIMDFFNKRPRLNSFDQFSRANSHPPRPRPTFNLAATLPLSPRATSRVTWFKGL